MPKKIFNDYFDKNIHLWQQQTENKELANLFALLEAKVNTDKEKELRRLECFHFRSIAPEFLVSKPPTALICVSEVSRSDLIKAGCIVEVKDNSDRVHKFSLMFDEYLIRCQLKNTSFKDRKLLLEIGVYENTNKIPLYISNYDLACQLICNKNKKIFENQKECGHIKPRARKEFLTNRVNPYFLIYQSSLLPMQHNFFDIEFIEELKPGDYCLEIDLLKDFFNLEDEVKINCIPIVGLFEECSGYTQAPIAAKAEIFDVIEVCAYDKNKEANLEDCEIVIEDNIAIIQHSGLLSAKFSCIAPCKGIELVRCDFGEVSEVVFLRNLWNKKIHNGQILEFFNKDIFADSQNIVNKINETHNLEKIGVKVSLTGGVKKNTHWSNTCPKYVVSLSINSPTLIGHAISWALTFQKLCDITRLCDVQITTPFGVYAIEDGCEW